MPKIIHINSIACEELAIYCSLKENQLYHINEPDFGLFIAESPKVIERALNSGYEPVSILIEESQLTSSNNEVARVLNHLDSIPIFTANDQILSQITGYHLTRGMLCAMKRRALPSLEEICKDKQRIAILEEVVNPTNVGAIVRSAAALNMDAILFTSGCSDPLYRRSIRVSMGCIFQVPWTYLNDKNNIWPDDYLSRLHALGFKTAAMALSDNSVSIDDEKLLKEEKLAIILGTEGEGLKSQTIADCDYTVKIPMSHGVDSLNVAAASAVAFWQLGKHI